MADTSSTAQRPKNSRHGPAPPQQQWLHSAEMDRQTRRLLGFERVLELVQEYAQSSSGRELLAELAPSADQGWLEERFELISECGRFLDESSRIRMSELQDPRPILLKLRETGSVLDAEQFQMLLEVLKAGREMLKAFRAGGWPLLQALTASAGTCRQEIEAIERTFDRNGEIRDSAHPQLGQVRRRQARLRRQVQDRLKGYFSGQSAESLIQDPFVTSRNGRFVIPVRSERQRDIQGVVHAASSSGATVFMEPLPVVPLNNQLISAQEQELEIIRQVLERLTGTLRDNLDSLDDLALRMGQADALFAICGFSQRYRCLAPDFGAGRGLVLEQARHPLLLAGLGEGTVPISVRLGKDQNGLVISGPNTGGKTVALKTVGLLALMAQSGLPVPAARARLPVFRQVLADIGDHQSISAHLSTFSAHILRIRSMIESLTPPSLILIDELGTGTDPAHGSALGIAVLEYFQGRETLVVATTHHQALKVFASSHPGLQNACVELDPKTHEPTYRIRLGLAGDSSGLRMALRLGLPEQIVERARGRMSDSERQAERYLEHLRQELDALHKSRQDMELGRQRLREEKARLQQEQSELVEKQGKEFQKALEVWSRQFKSDCGRYLKRVKDRFEAARLRQENQRKEALLKEEFRRRFKESGKDSQDQGASVRKLRRGDWVRHKMFGKCGKVLSIKHSDVTAEFEGKRMTCPAGQLEMAEPQLQDRQRRLPRNVTLDAVDEVDPQLNLIGATVDEAISRADKYLDRAFVAMQREVLLIHGFGSGKLRKAISELLKRHPHVASYKGEGGATRVTLRE